MENKYKFNYDDFSDRLFISCKNEDEIIDGSLRVLNLVLDFTIGGRIANIELIDASDYLKSLDINPLILNKLSGAEFNTKNLRNGYEVVFVLKSDKKTIHVPYNIYLPHKKQIIVTS